MATLRDLILADGPIGYWPLDDATYDQVTDVSGNGYHGSFVGTPGLLAPGPSYANPAMRFNGTNQGLTLPSAAIVSGANPRTIIVFVNLDWQSTSATNPIVCSGGTSSAAFALLANWQFPAADAQLVLSHNYTPSSSLCVARLRDMFKNRWAMIACVYTGTVKHLYAGIVGERTINSVSLVTSTLNTGATVFKAFYGLSNLDFGYYDGSTPTYTAGWGTNLAVFDQALSQDRLSQYLRAAAAVGVASTVPVEIDVGGIPTARRVRVFSRATGELLADQLTDSGGIASVDIDYGKAVDVIAIDDIGDRWFASTDYALTDRVFPAVPNGHWYEAEAGGTSGASEPVWPTTGGTVVDGSVTWRDKGTIVAPAVYGPFNPVEV